MYQVIIVVHVLLGLGVVGLVLLQQGKGADAGAAFGSASSGSVFGAQGASSFLSRTTAILAALFFSTSLGLAILSGHNDGPIDLMDRPEVEEEVFTDLPLIDGAEGIAPIKAIPLNKEDVPETLVVPEEISNNAGDSVSDKIDTVSDGIQNKVEDISGGAVDTASEKLDTVSDSVQNKAKEVIDDAAKIASDKLDTPKNNK